MEQTQTYIPWREAASLLGVKRSDFFYLVESGQIRAEPDRPPREGRYSVEDVHGLKAHREARKLRTRYRPPRARAAPVVLDWLSPADIPAILRLDQIVYHEIFLAEAARYVSWSEKNGQLAMCAFDAKSDRQVMLAYVAALPLPESVILQVMRHEREETSITKEEMLSYERPGAYTLLANSAVAHPTRPDLLYKVLDRMMAAWIERYPERYITRIYAQSVSERGEQMIQHFFMSPRYDLARDAYMLDLARPSASKIVRRFQAALQAKGPLPDALTAPYDLDYERPQPAPVSTPRAPDRPQHARPSVASGNMPDGLVSWRVFAQQHAIPESTVKRAIERGDLQMIEGSWIVGHSTVKGALDGDGRATFYRLMSSRPQFTPCPDCPHN